MKKNLTKLNYKNRHYNILDTVWKIELKSLIDLMFNRK